MNKEALKRAQRILMSSGEPIDISDSRVHSLAEYLQDISDDIKGKSDLAAYTLPENVSANSRILEEYKEGYISATDTLEGLCPTAKQLCELTGAEWATESRPNLLIPTITNTPEELNALWIEMEELFRKWLLS